MRMGAEHILYIPKYTDGLRFVVFCLVLVPVIFTHVIQNNLCGTMDLLPDT